MKEYNIGIVGATGAVGEEIALILEEQNFPVKELVPLASSRSLGKSVAFKNREIPVVELTTDVFAKHH
ncbi:MAG: aspartate-semialdehyde dehydrogenase, partial [Helicobacter sp.]|nr:aspartate-semialdehyde dehydrogenase [Helicobacter sp.]